MGTIEKIWKWNLRILYVTFVINGITYFHAPDSRVAWISGIITVINILIIAIGLIFLLIFGAYTLWKYKNNKN